MSGTALHRTRSGHTPPLPAATLWLRVPGFTVPSVTLAILAHLAAGGAPPSLSMLALLFGSVAVLSASLTPRERRLPQLLAGVGLVQVGVHVALLEHHSPASPAHQVSPAAMTAAHVVATLLLAWWLRRAEAALWRAADRVLHCLIRPTSASAFPITACVAAPTRQQPRPRRTPALTVPTLRGPPRWL